MSNIEESVREGGVNDTPATENMLSQRLDEPAKDYFLDIAGKYEQAEDQQGNIYPFQACGQYGRLEDRILHGSNGETEARNGKLLNQVPPPKRVGTAQKLQLVSHNTRRI